MGAGTQFLITLLETQPWIGKLVLLLIFIPMGIMGWMIRLLLQRNTAQQQQSVQKDLRHETAIKEKDLRHETAIKEKDLQIEAGHQSLVAEFVSQRDTYFPEQQANREAMEAIATTSDKWRVLFEVMMQTGRLPKS